MALLQITRARALAVVAACGWKSADGWTDERLASKLCDVPEVAPEEGNDKWPDEEEVQNDLKGILEHCKSTEDDEKFEIVADEGSASSETGEGETKEEEKKDVDKEEKSKKKEKEAKKEKKKADDDKAKAKKKEEKESSPTPPRPKAGRGFCAGAVIKKHGLKSPITDEMVAEVDEMCGKENPKESKAWLGMAWHIVNGYTGEIPLPKDD